MSQKKLFNEISLHIGYLFHFAKIQSEVDFAASLSPDYAGAENIGWRASSTAFEIFDEITPFFTPKAETKISELRHQLLLYCQLSEAGGVYRMPKNFFKILKDEKYSIWPFQKLVRVRKVSGKVIGPNANATFKELAKDAQEVGMTRLANLFEEVFHEDVRNAIFHTDYIIAQDGLRVRRRDGGPPFIIDYDELNEILSKGYHFFKILKTYMSVYLSTYYPPKEIVGKFSTNTFPMLYTVGGLKPSDGFSISTSSPGAEKCPNYERQETINEHLGGKVINIFYIDENDAVKKIRNEIIKIGFEPQEIILSTEDLDELIKNIESDNLWMSSENKILKISLLMLTPFGYSRIENPEDIKNALPLPEQYIEFRDH